MFGDILIGAVVDSEESIGEGMAWDSLGAQTFSGMEVNLSNQWLGPEKPPATSGYADWADWLMNNDVPGTQTPYMDPNNDYVPASGVNYTINQAQAAVEYIAAQEQGASPDKQQALEAARQAWSAIVSQMGQVKDLQMAPITALGQQASSDLQQDQSYNSGAASLGNGMADFDKIAANLLPNIS